MNTLSEIQIQAACFQWAWNFLPQTRHLFFHVGNGGQRNKIEAMQMKASGLVPGIPDMLFLWNGKLHAFEFKTLAGRLSPDQVKVHQAWLAHRVHVHVVRDIEQFKVLFLSIIQSQ